MQIRGGRSAPPYNPFRQKLRSSPQQAAGHSPIGFVNGSHRISVPAKTLRKSVLNGK